MSCWWRCSLLGVALNKQWLRQSTMARARNSRKQIAAASKVGNRGQNDVHTYSKYTADCVKACQIFLIAALRLDG
jgi:hypothetical protein